MAKIMKKILTAVLSLAMVACFVPQMNVPVYAANEGPASMAMGSVALSKDAGGNGAQTVWYAGSAWRVIGYNGGGVASTEGDMTLLASDNLKTGVQFNTNDKSDNDYEGSNLKSVIDDLYEDRFSSGEKTAVKKRTLEVGECTTYEPYSTGVSGTATSGYLWPLSTEEALGLVVFSERFGVVLVFSELLQASDYWWLRSPGYYDSFAAYVDPNGVYPNGVTPNGDPTGFVNYIGFPVDRREFGVRPAFNLNLKSVLFTSAAAGGKSSGAEGALNEVGTNTTGKWKLTLLDDGTITGLDGHKDFKISSDGITYDSEAGTVTVPYSGAATGDNEYISAIIKDSNGNIKYYGRIAKASAADNASVPINIDGKFGSGDTLWVFNEQYNGDETTDQSAMTDYASALQEVKLYQITFHPNNGNPTFTETVEAGGTIKTKDPKRVGYYFVGWYRDEAYEHPYNSHTEVNSSFDLYGGWIPRNFDISFVNEDGTELQSGEVAYDDTPSYTGQTPTKKDDAKYSYTFAGWTPEIKPVTGDATYTAKYISTVKQYSISFVNEDGTELQSGKVAYGDTPSYTGQTPTKKDDAKYSYTFAGWNPEIKPVTGNATYKATYTAKKKPAQPQPKVDKAAAKIALDAGIIAKSSGSKVTASWGAVKGASSYVIYANYCGQKKLKKIRTVSGKTTSFDITKLNGKKFNPKKNLKFYVVAYTTVKGKKVKLAKSIMAHAPGSKNSKRTNVTGVKVKKSSFKLKKGKTAKIKAKLVLEKKSRKPLKHEAKFRYATSNTKVAKVNKKGKITAVGKGKCTVYVYAVSGVSKKIKVTVK